jgi:hypothetical protein
LPSKSEKCDTSRYPIALKASPPLLENAQRQPVGNKKFEQRLCKTDSDWSESVEDKLETVERKLKAASGYTIQFPIKK